MRHQLSGRQLSRNSPHRHAMLRNLAAALLRYETIRTTLPKAKELRRIVEPLITLGKADSDANRRRAFARLRDAEVVVKLFEHLGPRFKTRPGGYTRILKMDVRPGDAAPMAMMQLLDQPESAEDAKAGSEATEAAESNAVPKKQAATKKKTTSPKKKAVKTAEEKAAKQEKAAKKVAAKARKVEAKAEAKAKAKTQTQKKKASAKKKTSVKKKGKK